MAATEHERARSEERVEQRDRLAAGRAQRAAGRASSATKSARRRCRPGARSDCGSAPVAARARRREQRAGRSSAPPAMIATCANGVVQASATPAAASATARRGQSGVRLPAMHQTAWATTATAASLRPWTQPAPAGRRRGEQPEGDQGDRGRQGEPEPCRDATEHARPGASRSRSRAGCWRARAAAGQARRGRRTWPRRASRGARRTRAGSSRCGRSVRRTTSARAGAPPRRPRVACPEAPRLVARPNATRAGRSPDGGAPGRGGQRPIMRSIVADHSAGPNCSSSSSARRPAASRPCPGVVGSLPPDFPAPIVIAQHLDPRRPSHLGEILARHATMPIKVVDDGSRRSRTG